MGRMYAVTFSNVAVSAIQDLFEIAPATNKPILIHSIYLSQSTDVGDAEEEMLRINIIRGHTASGSGGSTPTPAPLPSATGAAAGITAKANNTTVASAGTVVTLHAEAFNIRAGWQYIPTPEARPGCSAASSRIVVRLVAAPADSVNMSGTMIIEEMG